MQKVYIVLLLNLISPVIYCQLFNTFDTIELAIKDIETKEILKKSLILIFEKDSNKRTLHELRPDTTSGVVKLKLNRKSTYAFKGISSRLYLSALCTEQYGYFKSKKYTIYLKGMFGRTENGEYVFTDSSSLKRRELDIEPSD
jgi:hypothetical protein